MSKITYKQLLNMAWEQAQMITDPYQKAMVLLEMAELIQEDSSESCDCEKEFSEVEKKRSTKKSLKASQEKETFVPDEPAKPKEEPAETEVVEVEQEQEAPTTRPVGEIDNTWTDAMYEMFKDEYENVQSIIKRYNLSPAIVCNIVKKATDNAHQPSADAVTASLITREGMEQVHILPHTIKLVNPFMNSIIEAKTKKTA